MDLSLSAILTSSGKDWACIFFITWLRCILTVASLAASSAAICLLSIPETTRFITSRSRTLNALYRCCSYVSLFFADDAISSERALHRIEQILVPEWFGEKLNRARLHGLDRHWNVCVRCEKNDWNTYSRPLQFVLKIQAANAGESHIKNQTTGTITARTRQELLCSSERLRMQADGLQQFLE